MSVRHEGLVVLHAKYREMHEMRVANAAGRADDPKLQMRALAERFPGALRELDELPLAEIAARLQALEGAMQGGPVPAWVTIQLRYHGWLRVGLGLKTAWAARLGAEGAPRRHATPPEIEALLRSWWAEYRRGPHEPTPEEVTVAVAAELLRPPAGRLTPWVCARVAQELGLETTAVAETISSRWELHLRRPRP